MQMWLVGVRNLELVIAVRTTPSCLWRAAVGLDPPEVLALHDVNGESSQRNTRSL